MISPSSLSVKIANDLYKKGNYYDALHAYLQLSLTNQYLSFALRADIELCARKLEATGELNVHTDHTRYFRYGYGHSSEFGALYFDNDANPKHATLIAERADTERKNISELKIVFVADSNQSSNKRRKVWGAETSAGFVANYGKYIGYDVSTVDPYNFDKGAILSADLLVLRSIERLNDEHRAFLKSVL